MTTKNEKVIVIPAVMRGAARVTVRGLSDLIVHKWSDKAEEEIRYKQAKGAKKAREKRDPRAEFEDCKYLDKQGRDCLLGAAIKGSIVGVARNLDKVKMTDLRQQVFVREDLIPIAYESCEMRCDPVTVGNGKDLRYRPCYRNWSATFVIEWDAGKLEVNQVLHLLQLAGYSVGIHEWRPERSGNYGRFELTEAVGASEPDTQPLAAE